MAHRNSHTTPRKAERTPWYCMRLVRQPSAQDTPATRYVLTCCGPHEAHACDLTHRKGEGVGCRHESGHCVGHGKTRQNDEQAPKKGAGQHSGGAWPVWRLCQAGKHEPSHLCKRGMQRGARPACDVAPKTGNVQPSCQTTSRRRDLATAHVRTPATAESGSQVVLVRRRREHQREAPRRARRGCASRRAQFIEVDGEAGLHGPVWSSCCLPGDFRAGAARYPWQPRLATHGYAARAPGGGGYGDVREGGRVVGRRGAGTASSRGPDPRGQPRADPALLGESRPPL
eukprot:scaffold641_cov490-Prasinococcus_capsulatus_cf.AAC.8